MNHARLLRIANRIHLLLMRDLGQGIDVQRMLREPLYQRDVLLVCDAFVGSDLASLAQHFRSAQAEPLDDQGQASQISQFPASQSSSWGSETSGFAASGGARGDSMLEEAARQPAPRPRWRSPGRWLGR